VPVVARGRGWLPVTDGVCWWLPVVAGKMPRCFAGCNGTQRRLPVVAGVKRCQLNLTNHIHRKHETRKFSSEDLTLFDSIHSVWNFPCSMHLDQMVRQNGAQILMCAFAFGQMQRW